MNFHRLPMGPRANLPVTTDARSVEVPYRGGVTPEFEQRELNIRGLILRGFALVVKYRLLIAACCAASLLLGFVVTYLTPKTYTAFTIVKIDRAAPKVLNNQRDDVGGWDPNFLHTEFELLRSRSLAERVAASLNLGQSDFSTAGRVSLAGRLLGRRGGARFQKTPPWSRPVRSRRCIRSWEA